MSVGQPRVKRNERRFYRKTEKEKNKNKIESNGPGNGGKDAGDIGEIERGRSGVNERDGQKNHETCNLAHHHVLKSGLKLLRLCAESYERVRGDGSNLDENEHIKEVTGHCYAVHTHKKQKEERIELPCPCKMFHVFYGEKIRKEKEDGNYKEHKHPKGIHCENDSQRNRPVTEVVNHHGSGFEVEEEVYYDSEDRGNGKTRYNIGKSFPEL
jgi:hypothetical protein